MIQLKGYLIDDKLCESERILIYRGIREGDARAVLLKFHKHEYPSPNDVRRFEHEFNIARKLDPAGVMKYLAIETVRHRKVLIMEDDVGITLREYLKRIRLGLADMLGIAIFITDIVEMIHGRGIFHRNICPNNIFINPDTYIIKIGGFGLAVEGAAETPLKNSLERDECPLEYISPEQTGRTSLVIDYRTDFYSLGVCFHELFTGRLPFDSADPMDLVYGHIAKEPRPPCEINDGLPIPLSDIILKLLAKSPDERYQSARGLKFDLKACLKELESGNKDFSIVLGERDFPDRLILPRKLYGRAGEIETLLTAFDELQSDARKIMLLAAGYSGVGKSVLVNEIRRPVSEKGGIFISGKFDQYKHNLPYSALIQAFTTFVDRLLTRSESELASWKSKISAAVGINGRVLTDIIPAMEHIIGEQPPAYELGPVETQNRFTYVFQNFIKAVCQQEHPIVLFVDDLQWADFASLNLLSVLMTDKECQYLMVLGAYRDNEVDDAHPLTRSIDKIRREGGNVRIMHLENISRDNVNALVSETLRRDTAETEPLADLVFTKTGGNAFFTIQFLKSLHEERLLTFDAEENWQWDISKIIDRNLTDNIGELMVGKMVRLPESTRAVVKLAACIGEQFELRTLSQMCEQSEAVTLGDLAGSVNENLVMPLEEGAPLSATENTMFSWKTDTRFKFLHDQVHQAAYALVPDKERKKIHLQIGRLILDNTTTDDLQDKLCEVAGHLNIGADLLNTREEKEKLARLNLMAGRKAKSEAAYEDGLGYISSGLEMLSDNSWREQYHLTLNLHEEAVEANFIIGDFYQVENLVRVVLDNAVDPVDIGRVSDIHLRSFTARNQPVKAIEVGLEALERLGVPLTDEPDIKEIVKSLPRIEDLENHRVMTNRTYLSALQLIKSILAPMIITAPEMLPRSISTMVRLCINEGHSKKSALAYVYFGMLLCARGDFEAGYHAGRLALEIIERFDAPELKSEIFAPFCGFISHWKTPIRRTLDMLLEGLQNGLEFGIKDLAGYCAFHYCHHLLWTGALLETVSQRQKEYIELLTRLKLDFSLSFVRIMNQMVLNLQLKSPDRFRLTGDSFDEETMLPALIESQSGMLLFSFHLAKEILFYLFGDYPAAIKAAESAAKYSGSMLGSVLTVIHNFYFSLALLARSRDGAPPEAAACMERVEKNQRDLEVWAQQAPMNYLNKYELVEAERRRNLNQNWRAAELYERAVKGADKNGYMHEEALACELAGRFHISRGLEKPGRAYITEAYYLYTRWGGLAKAGELEKEFHHFITNHGRADMRTGPYDTRAATAFPFGKGYDSIGLLDLDTVIKAARVISGEIDLKNLLSRLMKIIIENAGAQKGYLILNQDDRLQTAASIHAGEVKVLPNVAIEKSRDFSENIVRYVNRTGLPVILHDAINEGKFQHDPHILLHGSKSVLCMPIRYQDTISGVLYLDNNLTTNAFSEERIELLKILLAQAAISIENARLYDTLRIKDDIIESASSAIAILDLDGNLTYANPVFKISWGIEDAAGCLGTPFSDFWGAGERFDQAMKILLSEGAWIGELRARKRDGALFDAQVSMSRVFDRDGAPIALMSTSMDISEKKAAEKGLKESESRYRSLFNNIRDLIFIHDLRGNIIEVNQTAGDCLGYSQSELQQKNIMHITLPRLAEQIPLQIKDIQEQGTVSFESAHVRRDGVLIPVEINACVITYRGKPAVLSVARDISERMQAEENRKNMETRFRQAQKMEAIGTLAGGIAHDFNNILGAIIGFTDVSMEMVAGDSKLQDNLEQILRAGLRAEDLVKQILTFSRQTEQELVPIRLNSIIIEALKLLRATLPSTIEICHDLQSDGTILADPTQMHQVLMNLCTNAAYAMRESGGVLKVSLDNVSINEETAAQYADFSPGMYLRLIVIDTGQGMSPDTLNRIFDPFFTTKEKGEGTGMGLAVVHGVVKSHGGAITAYSEPDKGSMFRIFLPLLEIEEERGETSGRADPLPAGEEHILFVDDEIALVELAKRMLKPLGYKVTARTSSLEALELFGAGPDAFDLLITDYTMPNMTGVQLARKLLRINPDLPIILCTGFSQMITEEQAEAIGIKRFILKPMLVKDMARAIREVLNEAKEHRDNPALKASWPPRVS